jgi:DNA-binding beta-propeller fold protein YncE/mono/diheme cytochrome c family protein
MNNVKLKRLYIQPIGRYCLLCAGIFIVLCFKTSTPPTAPIDHPSSVLVFDAGQQIAIASDKDNTLALNRLPLTEGSVWRQLALSGKPSGIVASRDGKTLFVTCGEHDGALLTINPASASVTYKIAAGHYPVSPVLSAAGDLLYFCRRFTNEIVSVDLAKNKIVQTIPVKSEPVALALVAGKPLLLAAHQRPYDSSVSAVVASSVSVVDLVKKAVVKEITLPNGSTNVFHIALSPDGKYAYIPHTLGRYLTPTTQLERGWMNTNALSIIDVAKQELLNTVLLDDLDLGATNPYDLCVTDNEIVVTHAGSHELSVINREQLHSKLERAAQGKASNATYSVQDVPDDLSFMADCRVRVSLKGNGPRSASYYGGQVYVAGYFSNSVEMLQLSNRRVTLVVQAETVMTKAERGEMLFHDGRVCFQQWQSCASCHPDARVDGLNWDLLNDGLGNPKNTKSLLLSHVTPPTTITGIRPNAEYSVRSGIRHIQFVERPDEDAVCMDEYLKALQPAKSPYLVNGDLSKAAKRGKKLFESAGCIACHKGAYFTDMKLHPVGATADYPKNQTFDTPTLIEVWRTPPFLYDGRAETLKDMMTKFNDGDRHGITHSLSEKQLTDLAEYVLSL